VCYDEASGTAVAQWLRCCATIRNVAGSIPAGVSGFFNDIKSFRSHYGPGVDSASNRNEYREYFLGGKGGRCVRLTTLPPSCAVFTKSGNLNFLEPSGLVQACNGTALPFTMKRHCFLVISNFSTWYSIDTLVIICDVTTLDGVNFCLMLSRNREITLASTAEWQIGSHRWRASVTTWDEVVIV